MSKLALLLTLLAGCLPDAPAYPAAQIDDDGDGFSEDAGDCDDADPAAFPGQAWFTDDDGDGVGADPATGCGPPPAGFAATDGDCAPDDPARSMPGTWYSDTDGDGYGSGEAETCGPVPGAVALDGDCAPDDPFTSPGAPEDCGTADRDCGTGPDPLCRLSGDVPATRGIAHPEANQATTPPELDDDPQADVLLLGTYDYQGYGLTSAFWTPLDSAGGYGAIEHLDTNTVNGALRWRTTPDLDADGVPEVFLVGGDYQIYTTTIWHPSVPPATDILGVNEAFLVRSEAEGNGMMGVGMVGADLTSHEGVELALTALGYTSGSVEIYAGFASTPQVVASVDGPPGTQFAADLGMADLDGDGVADLATTSADFRGPDPATWKTCLWLFRGPFAGSRAAADADASLCTADTRKQGYPQVEISPELDGSGLPWVWFAGVSEYDGAVLAVPGATESAYEAPITGVDHRELRMRPGIDPGTGNEYRHPRFGASIGVAGDQTGDALPDLLIGHPTPDFNLLPGVWLVDSHAVVAGPPGLRYVDEVAQARITAPGEEIGYVATSAGDVDGDGWDEVWVSDQGAAYLLTGGLDP